MITAGQVPEENKRLLIAFRDYLVEEQDIEETEADAFMADVSLYAIEYSAECLQGSCITDINAFDVYCFLADYGIRQEPERFAQSIETKLKSLSSFCGFLAEEGVIGLDDLCEILVICNDPKPFAARCEEYHELCQARDQNGLQKWRESVLDTFSVS